MDLKKLKDERIFDFVITNPNVVDKQGDTIPKGEIEEALDKWLLHGAVINEQHSNRNVGKGLRWWTNDNADGKYFGRAVIHKNSELADRAWSKILKGEFGAVSIGGGAFNKQDNLFGGKSLGDLDIVEISLCEDPAHPDAQIIDKNMFAKFNDSELVLKANFNAVDKKKIYLTPGEKPPQGAGTQRGPRGGTYYDSSPSQQPSEGQPSTGKPSSSGLTSQSDKEIITRLEDIRDLGEDLDDHELRNHNINSLIQDILKNFGASKKNREIVGRLEEIRDVKAEDRDRKIDEFNINNLIKDILKVGGNEKQPTQQTQTKPYNQNNNPEGYEPSDEDTDYEARKKYGTKWNNLGSDQQDKIMNDLIAEHYASNTRADTKNKSISASSTFTSQSAQNFEVMKPGASIHSEKFDRCVEHVKSSGKDVNAYAVCTAQLGSEAFKKESVSYLEVLKELENIDFNTGGNEMANTAIKKDDTPMEAPPMASNGVEAKIDKILELLTQWISTQAPAPAPAPQVAQAKDQAKDLPEEEETEKMGEDVKTDKPVMGGENSYGKPSTPSPEKIQIQKLISEMAEIKKSLPRSAVITPRPNANAPEVLKSNRLNPLDIARGNRKWSDINDAVREDKMNKLRNAIGGI